VAWRPDIWAHRESDWRAGRFDTIDWEEFVENNQKILGAFSENDIAIK
jgi:hypothetical protein